MKNLLIIFTLFLGLGAVNAQARKTVSKPAIGKGTTNSFSEEQTPAEVKGPTKEETMTYIKNCILNAKYSQVKESGPLRNTYEVEYNNVVLEGCILQITYSYTSTLERKGTYGVQATKNQVWIPIDRIENVISNDRNLELFVYQKENAIKTSQKGERTVDEKRTTIDESKTVNTYLLNLQSNEIEKLVKAFNHLRKLCGAPEPISFD
jgi:hypothetical protein